MPPTTGKDTQLAGRENSWKCVGGEHCVTLVSMICNEVKTTNRRRTSMRIYRHSCSGENGQVVQTQIQLHPADGFLTSTRILMTIMENAEKLQMRLSSKPNGTNGDQKRVLTVR